MSCEETIIFDENKYPIITATTINIVINVHVMKTRILPSRFSIVVFTTIYSKKGFFRRSYQ